MSTITKQPLLKKDARIGILNRGEAAVRFIRAVREYNALHGTELKTVAFFIDKEEGAPFVKMADDDLALSTLSLFPGKQKSPYLDHELMIEALEETDCSAIWVGWGFVSEDAVFAEKIEKKGIVFMGPSSQAMGTLGDKIQAKDLAETADVPILPWSKKSVDTLDDAKRISEEIGYPVIVKAANAGGGRGIRFVRTPEELETQYKSAQEETIRITGNSIVFIERLVEKGRHLEVQCLADYHGNVNTFGVRDCSVQRKNQKIIEETPPPHFTDEAIKMIEESSARLIKAADYHGAGTVEYLYDLIRNEYYFMEVNTRLQVEHPITETLYGIDLVKSQIDVAFGNVVDLSHRKPDGWVMEVRLNAEDPERDFTPAPGDVTLFKPPAGSGIRVDSGIEQGSEIPSDFDSMVAKVIAAGPTRKETMARLKRALQEMRIRIHNGTTNRAFLLELLDNADIVEGGVHTGYVEELLKDKEFISADDKVRLALIAGAIEMYFEQYREELLNFKQQLRSTGRPRSIPKAEGYEVILAQGGNSYTFLVKSMGSNVYHLEFEGQTISCQYSQDGQEAVLLLNGHRHNILMVPRGDMLQCEVDGVPVMLESDSGGYVSSPSPAIVLSVNVKQDQPVKKGDVLVVLEAMKMEMLVEAPSDGVVKEICVGDGEQVAAGQPLVQLDAAESDEVEEPSAPAVTFEHFSGQDEFSNLEREFLALFLGYDHPKKGAALLKELLAQAKASPEAAERVVHTIIRGAELYTLVETLFGGEEIEAEAFARPMTYTELVSHYFRRDIEREKGLPDVFLNALNKAIDCYPVTAAGEVDAQDQALLHIFKSHGDLANKQDVLKNALFALDELPIAKESHARISEVIDQLTVVASDKAQSLTDAALHVRFMIVDQPRIKELQAARHKAVESLLEKALTTGIDTPESLELMESLVDAGSHIIPKLLQLALSGEARKQALALRLLTERFNRDRDCGEGSLIQDGDVSFYSLTGTYKNDSYASVVAVQSEADAGSVDLTAVAEKQGIDNGEIVLLIDKKNGSDSKVLIEKALSAQKGKAAFFCIGLWTPEGAAEYHTFEADNGEWKEITLRSGFCPLHYRELRVYRFSGFHLETLYRSESVTLLQGTAKDNPKDIRLFALGSVTESGVDVTEDGTIQRMVMFEAVLNESIFAMRAAQARYRYRLHWNRIIIHNRSLLELRLMQLRTYGMGFIERTRDLGLEKQVVYTRRKKFGEDKIRELELHLFNIADDQFSLRSRRPSDKPLSGRDEYATKVVTARQRKNVYPYEMIKMLTHAGVPLFEDMPKGEFVEYDIEVAADGSQKTVSVHGRPDGQNQGNIVFGIITNTDPETGIRLKRVLLLSDPTADMGTLAEPECRRVIAALELAEAEQIPVEWLPVSSGAKIAMDSGTENLDWTATALRMIVQFTQDGGEINIIVSGVNVGAQSYWNAEATMLMHTRGLLIMTDEASMLLTGKRALDFAGAVSGENNLDIGGVEKIMGPNGQSQVRVPNLTAAYRVLFNHYRYSYVSAGETFPRKFATVDKADRDITNVPYRDILDQGFTKIGDIFSLEKNGERKKPFDIRQVMSAVIDTDSGHFERYRSMQDADTAIIWETRLGGQPVGMIGIESRNIPRIGEVPFDGPETWNGGTLFPQSSKKVARGINAFSGRMPLVILANLSGFDGSPESLRRLQLEYGAEIGRAIVNFKGPITFVVVARYHGGAYVVFSKSLNPNLRAAAIQGSYASVLGGAPAAAVVFPRMVAKEAYSDKRIVEMQECLKKNQCSKKEYDALYQKVYAEKQTELGQKFDQIHSVQRAKEVGSIDDIIDSKNLRPYLINSIEEGIKSFTK